MYICIYVNNIKVMLCNSFGRKRKSIKLNKKPLKEVDCLGYFGIKIATNDKIKEKLSHRVGEEMKICRTL